MRDLLRRWSILGRLGELPRPMRLIVLGQLAFNTGFYLVLPFFALHLTRDLGFGGALVGLLLGLRTFSQQGLFFLGGALADRFGTRPVALTGFVVRIAGFLLLALAAGPVLLVAGTVATGFAAALFSPAVEAELARRAGDLERSEGPTRSEAFAMFGVAGEVGIVVGPVIGSLLLTVDFAVTTVAAAGVFVVVLVAFARGMPREPAAHAGEPILAGWGEVLRNRAFLSFTLAYASWLLSYNQLYLALPVELDRVGAAGLLGGLFVVSAVMVVLGQLPLAEFVRRRLGTRALPMGFAVLALAFLVTAALIAVDAPGPVPAVAFVVTLTLGQMTVVPVAQDAVGRLAGERRLGAHFGVLASAGGLAVLGGSSLLGALLDAGGPPALPWAVTAALPLASAIVMGVLVRRVPALAPEPSFERNRS
ncbi:putative MFS family arabinose efflux permease [Actinomycetospora succinea]|uniref:Putative MFS family arabinose efflux permease n=1 Tax=Actinomycetospora succinea TaxID=663603 RepID=A0A4R6VL29_9PSEU|nr:MFS transporter [Actinomycetospora succinea]TDQ62569.1 putative MFS family arabinose efflux permease [Actinomycetospora succinea]